MNDLIVVLNVGSSSVKGDLFSDDTLRASAKREEVDDFAIAIDELLDELLKGVGRDAITAVGHRIVHGGAELDSPVAIDDDVIAKLEATTHLAPLHNPPALRGIEIARRALPKIKHYAVFDTAFHATLPEHAKRYAVSRRLFEEYGVRRFGFHGTSHAFVARRAAEILERPLEELRLITLHLGNGASAAAIDRGRSVDTSMGLTPLEGLVMGSRSGDLDPAVPLMLLRRGMSPDEIETELNERSGLLGIAGVSDMREVVQRAGGDANAKLALTMFAYRIKKYIGAYLAILGGPLDAIVFTGGIGEHAAPVRQLICDGLGHLGIAIDEAKNARPSNERIERDDSRIALLVIATDEEREIARQIIAAL